MPHPALEDYIARLHDTPQPETRVWKDAEGRAQGRYFNSTLTSAFQSIRRLDSHMVTGFEGFIRSYSSTDDGLSLWKLLDLAASDDESIELDRLCRLLHAINFFRQPAAAGRDLYLSVHARLLAAVDGNHGIAFRRILDMLGVPQQRVVLQLPAIVEQQGWLLNYVADNYRRNGFRVAINAADAAEALDLLHRVRADVVKVDGREIADEVAALRLAHECANLNLQLIFKRVENRRTSELIQSLGEQSGHVMHAQGYLWDIPKASLDATDAGTPAAQHETVIPRAIAGAV
ncbi:EAL domain-containing protein [Noviherbaspirillum cavernae]|uniref:EAL domain-containing protein n=1 Tax=Noviherbaspirillum cavernae TaxID=2320862 RepID=A0A418WZA1_9BURK|nr:EAL domain-containing protein [Noviherbaspirillum cavernae]RJG05521.1 EAL domain-containing protein [Noviherbaspirillum cavernae]